MRITKIELRHLKLPLVSPFETSFSRVNTHETIIVIMQAGPITGYGEIPASAYPYYSSETVTTCWYIIKNFLAPSLLKLNLDTPVLTTPEFKRVRGHNMAKAGLIMALSDLKARSRKQSLSRFYGGKRAFIMAGISLGVEATIELLLDKITNALSKGYHRIKIKIKPGWDIKVIQAIRKRFPALMLSVDANGAYTLKDWRIFKTLDKYRLLMIEQPLGYNDFLDHATLQKKIKTPICLDESIKNPEDAQLALQLKSCRIINIKQARVGGPIAARKIHDLCLSHKIPVWCGGLLETGIGRAHNVALASLPNFKLPNDISASERYYREDIVNPPFTVQSDGLMKVPQGIGLGCEVNIKSLNAYTLRKELFA